MAMTKKEQQDKVGNLILRGEEIYKKEYQRPTPGFPFAFADGPIYRTWMGEINTLNERYFQDHPLYSDIKSTYEKRNKDTHAFEYMVSHLEAIYNDSEYWKEEIDSSMEKSTMVFHNNKIFIVHGHDDAAKQEMARTLEKAGFEAIILHEQADSGKTIIEKIEKNTDVSFAVVLYTECDYGRAKEDDIAKERFRARQNVVFEHGYLIGKLGRDRVCALVKGNVETPGDISGVVYTPMDAAGAWKMQLGKNMKDVGLDIDMNKLI